MFISEESKSILSEIKKFFYGTFYTVPKEFSQLLVIHVKIFG
jgi:hypothetical protein